MYGSAVRNVESNRGITYISKIHLLETCHENDGDFHGMAVMDKLIISYVILQ